VRVIIHETKSSVMINKFYKVTGLSCGARISKFMTVISGKRR